MGMTPPCSHAAHLANQATAWLLLLRSGRATQRDYAAFRAWRDTHPQNLQAWQRLTYSIDGTSLEGDASAPAIVASARPPASGRRRFLIGAGVAALASGTMLAVGNAVYPLQSLTSDASTGVGQRWRYRLSDGTNMLLDACSAADLRYTPYLRQLNLRTGAATLDAGAHDSRPFLTKTAEGTIRSYGARYMVRQQKHRTLVVAHEQPVDIQTLAGASIRLQPGMGIRFDALRLGQPSHAMAARAAWEHGLIMARSVTLNEIIESLRPYYSGKLRITMAAGGLPVSGDYSLDDLPATLRSLERELPIHVQRFTPWVTSITVASA